VLWIVEILLLVSQVRGRRYCVPSDAERSAQSVHLDFGRVGSREDRGVEIYSAVSERGQYVERTGRKHKKSTAPIESRVRGKTPYEPCMFVLQPVTPSAATNDALNFRRHLTHTTLLVAIHGDECSCWELLKGRYLKAIRGSGVVCQCAGRFICFQIRFLVNSILISFSCRFFCVTLVICCPVLI